MTGGHLLLVSLGPVQDFIAQARRSRDLWFGSHLLSELSRAAAASLAGADARLIFPALSKGDGELLPCDAPTRDGRNAPVSVANKILAELPEGVGPLACATAARAAAGARWCRIAHGVRRQRASVIAAGIDDLWNEQVDDILEFYAVWVSLGDDYRAARQAAERALAGRKNLRDFRRWRHDRVGAPKSSLDGARVSILDDNRSDPGFRRLRIAAGEQLDAIGLVKRAGFEPDQFVPLVSIAAGAWLERAAEKAREDLDAARQACAAQKIPPIGRALPAVAPLRFDATVLFRSRWPALCREIDGLAEGAAAFREWGERQIGPLLKAMDGEPPAYVACLAADGDRMGQTLDGLASAEANREFSKALAKFPADARRIVEQDHLGSLIYAGGDDVLAFLPVARAPDCAKALENAFRARLGQALAGDKLPTLSVGIGVGHVIEPMSLLLDLARAAERAAKDFGRNALAIIVDKRSGGRRQFAMSWKCEPVKRLRQDAQLLDEKLSTGKVHELEALLRRFPEDEQLVEVDKAAAARALAGYAEAVLAHSGEGAKACLADIGLGPSPDFAKLRTALRKAIERVLVVRSLREWGFE
jgi:CRISPR-associated protein Cmr2